METFENRERGFENAFAHDEELGFRIRMGGLRRLGLWAAQTIGSKTPDSDAEALVARALEGATDETMLSDLASDLKSVGVSAHRLRARLATFVQEAAREVHEGRASGANHSTT